MKPQHKLILSTGEEYNAAIANKSKLQFYLLQNVEQWFDIESHMIVAQRIGDTYYVLKTLRYNGMTLDSPVYEYV